jgi:spoIIIJ-associated protein
MAEEKWDLDDVCRRIEDFLDPLLDLSDFDLDFDLREGGPDASELIDPDLTVDFEGDDVELLLANRGELLLALEHLTLEAIKIPHDQRYRVIFDANDYRVSRIEELRMTAEHAAEKVRRTGQPFHFQPMSSRERRILHIALREIQGVRTISEGMAPRRHTVIYPEK